MLATVFQSILRRRPAMSPNGIGRGNVGEWFRKHEHALGKDQSLRQNGIELD
jgi:hypothetical protein